MSTALAMFPFAIGSQQVYRVRIRLYEPVSGECLKAHAAQCRKRAGRRSLIIATEALALSDNEKPFRTCRSILAGSNPDGHASEHAPESQTLG